jgi:hypothetical protein
MDNRLNGLNALAYVGVAPLSVPQLIYKTVDPTSTDSRNFSIGCFWVNTSSEDVWVLVSLAKGVATWIKFAGSPGVALSFPTDSGTAFPNAPGQLVVHGGSNINTSGATNVVTVNLDNNIVLETLRPSITFIGTQPGDDNDPFIEMLKNPGAAVSNGEYLGSYAWGGNDGTGTNVESARITAVCSGTPSTGIIPTEIQIYTCGALGEVERMRIESSGNVLIEAPDAGNTSPGLTVLGNDLTVVDDVNARTYFATGDQGTGFANTTGLTNVTNVTSNSSGTFTIASKTTNNLASTGFIKIYVGATAYWVPIFSTPSP